MTDVYQRWSLDPKRIKKYRHFDAPISRSNAEDLANCPMAVAHHAFYPFLKFTNKWTKFTKKFYVNAPEKERKIRYAARRDAYIYMRYRALLQNHYEAALSKAGLDQSVVAYRRVLASDGSGKSNIEIAKDTFDIISKFEKCVVITADISSFLNVLITKDC